MGRGLLWLVGEPKEEENCYAKLYHQIDALNLRAAQVKQQLSKVG